MYMYIAFEAVLLKLHSKLAPGWALIRGIILWSYTGNGAKRDGCSFVRLWHKF